MFRFGKKNNEPEMVEELPPRRRKDQDERFRVGRAMAGDASQTRELKQERLRAARVRKRKNIATVIGAVILLAVVVIVAVNFITSVISEREKLLEPVPIPEPTVAIVDENVGSNISDRVKEFVVRLENDIKLEGYEIDRIVLPYQKARQIDVYIKERKEYYKLSIDRSSAVQAEDLGRMLRYIDDRSINCEYVDLRVEGKAYYK
jgi:hypothetical protein